MTQRLALLLLALAAACGPPPPLPPGAACPAMAPLPSVPQAPRAALNAYFLQEEATRSLRRGEPRSAVLEEVLTEAARLGTALVRAHAFNDGADKIGDSAMQTAPLVYDETALRGLDLVLARAAVHGVRLVLTLGNHWDAYGGARRYVAWAGLPEPREGDPRFYTEPAVINHYIAHVRRLLQRVNSVDGHVYGAHPAVLAWELLNEPRGEGLGDRGERLRAWVDAVAGAIKQVAPAARLATGEEGFEPTSEGTDTAFWSAAAPPWPFRASQSFRLNSASPFIDLASAHLYPEGWGFTRDATREAGERWIAEHAAAARALGKPLLLGEFGLRNDGLPLRERREAYEAWLACARSSGAASALAWMFADDARPDYDHFTFRWLDGTAPADERNAYLDLLMAAAPP